ncbi:MAG: hypothetical protein IKF97_00970 [Clostridia bacterium]|nr:hypothetical protein [Clostridia bacterium]
MENASKALLMAAGVLIGIVLLTMFVYLFLSYSETNQSLQTQIELGQIQSFNNKYLAYDRLENLTAYDINTVVNMANDNNDYYGVTEKTDTNYYIAVYVDGVETTKLQITPKDLDVSYMDDSSDQLVGDFRELKKYKCSVHVNPNTYLVDEIRFTENNNSNT